MSLNSKIEKKVFEKFNLEFNVNLPLYLLVKMFVLNKSIHKKVTYKFKINKLLKKNAVKVVQSFLVFSYRTMWYCDYLRFEYNSN